MMIYKVLMVCSLLYFAYPICDCEVNEDYHILITPTGFYMRNMKDFSNIRSLLNFSANTFKSHYRKEKLNSSQSLNVAIAEQNSVQRMPATDNGMIDPGISGSRLVADDRLVAQELDGGEESTFAGGLREIVKIFQACQKKVKGKFDKSHFEKFSTKILERARILYDCMKISSFRELDNFLSDDVIPITRNLDLVKKINVEDRMINFDNNESSGTYEIDILRKNWIHLACERMEKLFENRTLKFYFIEHSSEGRGRRRDHRMFAMMMMGFMIMASILVPMGFQFLTVLGGKSLLMAKMALIMSAINGLKKIATSNVGYGLYHAAGPDAYHHDPHYHGFHDKIFSMKPQEQENLPFNLVI